MSNSPETPSTSEWIKASIALVAAGATVYGLIIFARYTNRHPDMVNWFGIAAAGGAAFAFELFKYAITLRKRHEELLALQITLTPVAVDQLRKLTGAIAEQRKAQAAMAAAVELKARELQAERERAALTAEAEALARRLEALQQEERRLGQDARGGDEDLLRAYTLLRGEPDLVERSIMMATDVVSWMPFFGPLQVVGELGREMYVQARVERLRRKAADDPGDGAGLETIVVDRDPAEDGLAEGQGLRPQG